MNTVHRTYTFEGEPLPYEWAPIDGSAPGPLVIGLHGSNQDGPTFSKLWGTAGAGRAHFVFPTASKLPDRDGIESTHWISLNSQFVGVNELHDEIRLLAFIDDFRTHHAISSVYVAGFSSGGKLTQQLALRQGAVLAGTAVCSRSLQPEWLSMSMAVRKPHLEIIGDHDEKGEWEAQAQNISGPDNRDYWAAQLGHQLGDFTRKTIARAGTLEIADKYDFTTPGATPYRWFRIYGGRHRWARPAANDPISASQECLRFWGI